MKELILASGSPRRAELIKKIDGLNVSIIVPSGVDERFEGSKTITENVARVARSKAESVFLQVKNTQKGAMVLGCDTIVVLDNEVFGKPNSDEHALEMFKKLENRTHYVYTAICLLNNEKKIEKIEKTSVTFGALNYKIVYNYISCGNSSDKAGAYGIQDDAIRSMIVKIDGDIDNVIGLPTKVVAKIIN